MVLDAHTYELLNTIPVGKRPWGITFSPDGKYLFAANGPSDDVSVVDLATEKEIAPRKIATAVRGASLQCKCQSEVWRLNRKNSLEVMLRLLPGLKALARTIVGSASVKGF